MRFEHRRIPLDRERDQAGAGFQEAALLGIEKAALLVRPDAERAFAKTMADRDHAAFVSFLAEEAVFLPSDRALRGRDEVAAGWKRYFEGAQAPFSWQPERVEVVASGALAVSTGPVYDPAGKRIGTFTSTWRREPDGRWRIVLDSGCPPCACP